jgi:type III pantothenate kinase
LILLVDIGNTRVKWATLTANTLSIQQAASYSDWDRAALESHVFALPIKPERIFVSNVGGDSIAQWTREIAQAKWSMAPEFIRSAASLDEVRNAYVVPEQLGVDRWLCIIAAFQMQRRAVCVASIGTAMTVDGIDARGQHLGGIIVPGPNLAIASLFRGTSDLETRSESGTVRPALFADNTLGAIHQGVAHMLASIVDKSIVEMREQLGEMPTLLLTGGACDRVAPLLKASYSVIPDLVLRGLAFLARR